jgi:hypothetical protein
MSDLPDLREFPDLPDNSGSTLTITTTHTLSPARPSSTPSAPSVVEPQAVQPSSMVLGIDSVVPCSAAILANAQSKVYLGQAPLFWGRYFYAPGQINAAGKRDTHYASTENALLRAHKIRVLPIARQTTHVGQASEAENDAKNNVAAIFEVFPAQYLSGADPDILVFLDVEQGTPLAAAYYETWSATIMAEAERISNGRVRFHPAIYASHADEDTWRALKRAMDAGVPCDGVWMARYYYPTPVPKPWNDKLTTPNVALVCPILAWQYWESPDHAPPTMNFDTNLASSTHADMLMDRLVMPPSEWLGV